LTPAEARAAARRQLAEIDAGRDPTREREARRSMPTLAQFAESWLRDHVALKRKPATLDEYRRRVSNHLAPALGLLFVDRISTADVMQFHAKLAAQRCAANRAVATLSAMLTYAERLGLRPPASNPCRGVERYVEHKRKRPLADDELARLWRHLNAIRDRESPWAVAAIKLLLLTGCRKSEILSLRWTDVDHAAGVLRLRDSKTGPRAVVLSSLALHVLQEIPKQVENPHVIVGERDGSHLVNLGKPWNRIRRELGFPDVRIHDLRHTVATILARSAPLVVVRDALGHQQFETTSGYSHSANEDVRHAVDGLARQITGPQTWK
jgi:integrase